MSDITKALISLIRQNADIETITSGNVISDQLPQGFTVPAIVLWINSGRAHDTLAAGELGLEQPTFRLECYARRRIDAAALRMRVRNHIDGFAGVVETVFIKGIAQESGQRQRTDRVRTGSDEYRFVSGQDFRVTYDDNDPDQVLPTITTQPQNQTVALGEVATFTVAADDADSYQWQQLTGGQWQHIPGATSSSYSTAAATAEDNGNQYRVYVANAAGYVYSQVASLTVT